MTIRCGVNCILEAAIFLSTFCSWSIDGSKVYSDPCISNMATTMGQNDRIARTTIGVTCIYRDFNLDPFLIPLPLITKNQHWTYFPSPSSSKIIICRSPSPYLGLKDAIISGVDTSRCFEGAKTKK